MIAAAASWPQMSSTGEAILFWCVAIFMIACALGVLFFKKAAYAAISMVGVMLGLAVLYIAQDAPFLGMAHIIVYTGAIMMLFLFVIMTVGIGASDDYTRQRRGNIIGAALLGLGLVAVVGGAIGASSLTATTAEEIDPYSNEPITSLAATLFSEHWLAMELAGTLLITAAIGAVLLTRSDRLGPKFNQRAVVDAKMTAYKERGRHPGQLPAPGVYASSNSFDVPAIAGDTRRPLEDSVPRVLRVRGLDRSLDEVEPAVAQSLEHVGTGGGELAFFGGEASRSVGHSRAWGMGGDPAPDGLVQYEGAPLPDEGGEAPTATDTERDGQ